MTEQNVVFELKQNAALDCSSLEEDVQFFAYRGTNPPAPLPDTTEYSNGNKTAILKALSKINAYLSSFKMALIKLLK